MTGYRTIRETAETDFGDITADLKAFIDEDGTTVDIQFVKPLDAINSLQRYVLTEWIGDNEAYLKNKFLNL